MKKITILYLVLFSYIGINAQNTAHEDWDVLDKPVRRSAWVWKDYKDNQDLLIDFCRNKSINELYVFIAEYYWGSTYDIPNPDNLASFIKKANTYGIKVWGVYYLWDNEDGLNYMGNTASNEHVITAEKIMDAAASFNRQHPDTGLHGMQNDNEPKLTELLIPFIEFCEAANNRANLLSDTLITEGIRPLLHSAALRPGWVNSDQINYNGSDNYVAYHYLSVCNHASLMNYTSNGLNFKNTGEKILQWADDISGDQRVVIGVETDDIAGQWPSAINETYADEIQSENNENRFNIFEGDMSAGEDAFMEYDSYERIAIHSISGYFNHWFQGATWNEVAEAPLGTIFVDLSIDSSHWAEDIVITENAPNTYKTLLNKELFKLFPNPANNYVIVEFPSKYEGVIGITNQLGQVMLKGQKYDGTKIRLKTNQLSEGIYFISITNNKKVLRRKLVIK